MPDVKKPVMRGTKMCSLSGDKQPYTVSELQISYRGARWEHSVIINGLAATCCYCGLDVPLPDVDAYNLAIAEEVLAQGDAAPSADAVSGSGEPE